MANTHTLSLLPKHSTVLWVHISVYLTLAKHNPEDCVCLCSSMWFCMVLVHKKAVKTSCTAAQDKK